MPKPHRRILARAGARSTELTLQAISNSPATQDSVSALVRMARCASPVSWSMLVAMLVRVELWIKQPMGGAAKGVGRFVFMGFILGVAAPQSYINFSGKLL